MFGRKPKPGPEPKRRCENCERIDDLGPARYDPDRKRWLCGRCWVNSYVPNKKLPRDRFA